MDEVVIFDLDGVIIKGQSQQLFLDYIFSKKLVGLFFYLKICFWFILYKLGMVKRPQKVMNFAFSFLDGKKVDDTDKITADFFNEKLKKFIFPEIVDIIREHRANGRKLLIVSNSADIIVKKVAAFLGIENYVCTQLEAINGKFTGKILGDIVYGKNKVKFAKEFIKKNNLSFNNSYSYADHISDLNLLLEISKPYAVNPDRGLLKEAKKRNWPILIFNR